MKLNVTLSKTSAGDKDYLQILSDDQFSVNVVLIADEVVIEDHRAE